MSAPVIAFPNPVPVRAIVIEPLGAAHEDVCRAVIYGFDTSEDEPALSFHGPLQRVLRMAQDLRNGLPVIVHPEAKRRARR